MESCDKLEGYFQCHSLHDSSQSVSSDPELCSNVNINNGNDDSDTELQDVERNHGDENTEIAEKDHDDKGDNASDLTTIFDAPLNH